MFKINEIDYKFFLGSKKIWFLDKYEVIDISLFYSYKNILIEGFRIFSR